MHLISVQITLSPPPNGFPRVRSLRSAAAFEIEALRRWGEAGAQLSELRAEE